MPGRIQRTPAGLIKVSAEHPITEVTGACCKPDDECEEISEAECDEMGGNYLGDDVDCEGVDCAPEPGCCFAPFFADPFYGGDELYHTIEMHPQFCPDICGSGVDSSPCWTGDFVDKYQRFQTLTYEWNGCPEPIGNCISSGAVSQSTRGNEGCTAELDVVCAGEITYSDAFPDAGCSFPPQECEANGGNPYFDTWFQKVVSDPCPLELGACCSCVGCHGNITHTACDDIAAEQGQATTWHSGVSCEVGCPLGKCTIFEGTTFIICASTTASQCRPQCCSPPCPTYTFFWYIGETC